MGNIIRTGKDTRDTEIKQMYLMEGKEMEEIALELNLNLAYVQKILKNTKKKKRSSGEVLLLDLLTRIYHPQKILEQHPIGPYFLDFFLPHLYLAFEYDGEFHFKHSDFAHGKGIRGLYNFEHAIHNDTSKNKLCKKNGIYLIRISHTTKINEDSLRSLINEHHEHIINNISSHSSIYRDVSQDI